MIRQQDSPERSRMTVQTQLHRAVEFEDEKLIGTKGELAKRDL
jgi:hypothetical protein